MRKIRKLFLSLLLFPLALISCGANKVYGHYAFQMGSDKGTHFGVYVNLLNEDVYGPKEPLVDPTIVYKGKKFNLGMNFSDDIMPPDPTEESTIEEIVFWFFLQAMDSGLSGYFNVGNEKFGDLGQRLYLTLSEEDLPLELPEELASMFIVAFIDKNIVKIIMPVSLNDMVYQLCWYGLFIYFYEKTDGSIGVYPKSLYEEPAWVDELHYSTDLKERVGTHPTEHDVGDMNRVFEYIFKGNIPDTDITADFTFRDYNSLTIDLLKE